VREGRRRGSRARGAEVGKLGVAGGEEGWKKQSNPEVMAGIRSWRGGRGGQSHLQAGWGLGKG